MSEINIEGLNELPPGVANRSHLPEGAQRVEVGVGKPPQRGLREKVARGLFREEDPDPHQYKDVFDIDGRLLGQDKIFTKDTPDGTLTTRQFTYADGQRGLELRYFRPTSVTESRHVGIIGPDGKILWDVKYGGNLSEIVKRIHNPDEGLRDGMKWEFMERKYTKDGQLQKERVCDQTGRDISDKSYNKEGILIHEMSMQQEGRIRSETTKYFDKSGKIETSLTHSTDVGPNYLDRYGLSRHETITRIDYRDNTVVRTEISCRSRHDDFLKCDIVIIEETQTRSDLQNPEDPKEITFEKRAYFGTSGAETTNSNDDTQKTKARRRLEIFEKETTTRRDGASVVTLEEYDTEGRLHRSIVTDASGNTTDSVYLYPSPSSGIPHIVKTRA